MEPYWKYCFKGAIDFIRWRELAFMIGLFMGMYLWIGWGGIIIAIPIHFVFAKMNGGAVIDFNEYPEEPKIKQTCSAKIEGCNLCNNEYTHEFNVKYYKKFHKWYNF